MVQKQLNTLAKGAGIVFVGLLISRLFGYLFRLVVARIGAEQYGLLSLGLAITGILTTISLFGLHLGILRYISFYTVRKENHKVRGVISFALKISFSLSLVFGVLLFLFSRQISMIFFHTEGLAPILRIISFFVPFTVLGTVFLNSLTAIQKIKYEVYIKNVFEKGFVFFVSILVIYLGFGLFGVVFAYVLGSFLTLVLSFYYFRKNFFPILKGVKTDSVSKELFFYSWPLLLTGFIDIVVGWTDTLFLGFFTDTSQVGIYNVALPTAMLLMVMPRAILGLFVPVVTSLFAKGDNDGISNIYKIMNKWIFIVSFPLFLMLFFFSKPILRFLFGGVYVLGSLALSILALSYFYSIMFHSSTRMLGVIEKTKIIFNSGLLVAVSNIFLNFVLIPLYGINGAAIATSISMVLGASFIGVSTYKNLGLQPFSFKLIKIFVSSVLAMGVIFFVVKLIFNPVPFWILIPSLLLFGIIYLVILVFLGTFDKYDYDMFQVLENKVGLNLGFIKKILFKKN